MLTIRVNLPHNSWYATQYCAGEVTILRHRAGSYHGGQQQDENPVVFTVELGDRLWNVAPDGTGIIIK